MKGRSDISLELVSGLEQVTSSNDATARPDRRYLVFDSRRAFSRSWLCSNGPGVSGSSERPFRHILVRSLSHHFANLLSNVITISDRDLTWRPKMATARDRRSCVGIRAVS